MDEGLFYNTPGYSGDRLKAAKIKALGQEYKVLNMLSDGAAYSPSQVCSYIRELKPNTPITSIRRAMYNLTRKGLLVKTNKQIEGPYGHKEYLWKLKR